MLKLIKFFSSELYTRKLVPVTCSIGTRSMYYVNFDSEEEVIKNILGEIMMIGVNLPDKKNVLTETALEKLASFIEDFESNEKISAAVLHGCGGNFCTGTVSNKEGLKLSESLLKRLNEVKKPIIGSLDGYTTDFGLYLAIMCDMRVLDSAGLVGFKNKGENIECPSFVYERLLFTVGLSNALELMCTRPLWNAKKCVDNNFTVGIADSGSTLGKSFLLAQSIAFHRPLKAVIRDKSRILSFLK